MPVVDDVEKLRERTALEPDTLSDFVSHSERVWTVFSARVSEGHDLSVQNNLTGKEVTDSELVARSRKYRLEYLLVFSFQHLAAIFEAFFFDLLKAILVNNPIRLGPCMSRALTANPPPPAR
jgi:hypothetical protein